MAVGHFLHLGKAFQAALISIHALVTLTHSRPKNKVIIKKLKKGAKQIQEHAICHALFSSVTLANVLYPLTFS